MTDRGYQVSLAPQLEQSFSDSGDAIQQGFNDLIGQGLDKMGQPSNSCDPKLGLMLCRQMLARVDKEMRFYFEFTVVEKMDWRVGLVSAKRGDRNMHDDTFPGKNNDGSMGFASDGSVWYGGVTKAYTRIENDSFSIGGKTYGVLIDFARDNISFVSNGNDVGPAFGAGSMQFSDYEIKDQM
jgi:hypothetical protein